MIGKLNLSLVIKANKRGINPHAKPPIETMVLKDSSLT
jgi:hypothetical protein